MEAQGNEQFDHLFKILLVGDSGVGKSSLLVRFTENHFQDATAPTIGVDFRLKFVDAQDTRVKLSIWDTAGQERFRTMTSSFYRGAQAVIYVYDVTRRETFEGLSEVWLPEVAMYSTVDRPATMIVGNKVDLESKREVTFAEGTAFARSEGCLFVETSAKADVAVKQAFEELVLKILDSPSLCGKGQGSGKLGIGSRLSGSRSACC